MSLIPKVLVQTSKERMPDHIVSMLTSMCPDYEYKHFTDAEAIRFFQDNPMEEFPDIVDFFNNLHFGEHKADLFRYYFLYVNGGVYLDTDAVFHISIEKIIGDFELISVLSSWAPEVIFQGFIASVPKHPIIYKNLKVVYNTPLGYLKSNYHLTTYYFYHIWMDFLNKYPNQIRKLQLHQGTPEDPNIIID